MIDLKNCHDFKLSAEPMLSFYCSNSRWAVVRLHLVRGRLVMLCAYATNGPVMRLIRGWGWGGGGSLYSYVSHNCW